MSPDTKVALASVSVVAMLLALLLPRMIRRARALDVSTVKKAVVIGVACIFAGFVWPTPYEYTQSRDDDYTMLARNRFTGEVYGLVPDRGWVSLSGSN